MEKKLLLLFTCKLNKALLYLDLVFLGFRCLFFCLLLTIESETAKFYFLLLLFKTWRLKSEKKCRMVYFLCPQTSSHVPLQYEYAKIIICFANKYAELNFHCPVSRSVFSVHCSYGVWFVFSSFHLVIFCVTLVACAIDSTRPHCITL